MYTRKKKKGSESPEVSDLADKHQQFLEKMQNPAPTNGAKEEGDTVDGNISSTMERSFHLEELPDGSHISPIKVKTKDRKNFKPVKVSKTIK